MPGELSPYRETIIQWIVSSIGWPALDQPSEEQKAIAESMANEFDLIARAHNLPPEWFTTAEPASGKRMQYGCSLAEKPPTALNQVPRIAGTILRA